MGKQSNFYPAFPISTVPVGNQMINGGESLYKGSQLINEDGVTDKNTILLLNVWIHAGLPTSQIRDNQTARASWWEGPKIFFERVLQKMRQEYWGGLPFPSPRDLPDPGMEPGSPAGRFFAIWAIGKSDLRLYISNKAPGEVQAGVW